MSTAPQWIIGVPAAFFFGIGAMVGLATDFSLRILFAVGRWAWLILLLLGDD